MSKSEQHLWRARHAANFPAPPSNKYAPPATPSQRLGQALRKDHRTVLGYLMDIQKREADKVAAAGHMSLDELADVKAGARPLTALERARLGLHLNCDPELLDEPPTAENRGRLVRDF